MKKKTAGIDEEKTEGQEKIMKAVIQRVSYACVRVDGKITGEIRKGLLVLLGVAQEDEEKDLEKLVKKVTELRIFQDGEGKTNLSLKEIDGEILVVSQFTLLADCKKGRRPSFIKAGNPEKAKAMYEKFSEECRKRVGKVETGVFGADMKVDLQNDGPFTIVLDSSEL